MCVGEVCVLERWGFGPSPIAKFHLHLQSPADENNIQVGSEIVQINNQNVVCKMEGEERGREGEGEGEERKEEERGRGERGGGREKRGEGRRGEGGEGRGRRREGRARKKRGKREGGD